MDDATKEELLKLWEITVRISKTTAELEFGHASGQIEFFIEDSDEAQILEIIPEKIRPYISSIRIEHAGKNELTIDGEIFPNLKWIYIDNRGIYRFQKTFVKNFNNIEKLTYYDRKGDPCSLVIENIDKIEYLQTDSYDETMLKDLFAKLPNLIVVMYNNQLLKEQ